MNQSNNSVNLEYHQILTKILLWIAAGWYAFNGMLFMCGSGNVNKTMDSFILGLVYIALALYSYWVRNEMINFRKSALIGLILIPWIAVAGEGIFMIAALFLQWKHYPIGMIFKIVLSGVVAVAFTIVHLVYYLASPLRRALFLKKA